MIGFKDLAVILTAAMPPAPIEEQPKPARSFKGAIEALEREADALLAEARACSAFHDTLHDMAVRMR